MESPKPLKMTKSTVLSRQGEVFYASLVDISILNSTFPDYSLFMCSFWISFHANESQFFCVVHETENKRISKMSHNKMDNWEFCRLTNEKQRIEEEKIIFQITSYRINMTILWLFIPRKRLWKEIEHFRVYITKKNGITCCVSRASFTSKPIKSSCYGSK